MSQPDAHNAAEVHGADRRAAEAVVRHHAELAAALVERVARVVEAAETGDPGRTAEPRDQLLRWLRTELLPHAAAEEAALYPAAADRPGGRPLIDGMMAEHTAITALVAELEAAGSAVRTATAARALSALFQVHLAKENDIVLPLLLAAEPGSLAGVLEGMHALLGDDGAPAGAPAGGCGGHGACGCGGDAGRADAPAPVLSLDTRLDVRDIPHDQRHARVLAALEALPPDGALVLIAPHAPRPLLAEIDARYGADVDSEWLQDGPDVWQIRLHRQPATV